jgi:hypothetical protein
MAMKMIKLSWNSAKLQQVALQTLLSVFDAASSLVLVSCMVCFLLHMHVHFPNSVCTARCWVFLSSLMH